MPDPQPEPVLARAVLPPRISPLRGRRFAIIGGAVGALGLAAGLALMGIRGSSARVDVQIALPQAPVVAPAPTPPSKPVMGPRSEADGRIQVALLLDTSGSMNGLIDQARSQLWKIVTRLDAAHRGNKRPVIEIALYEYGNQLRATVGGGWIRQITPFTTDLDRVSEELFALTTNGGDEFVGKAIATAVSDLQWSTREGDLRLMFIAGNESFDQGRVTPASAMDAARAKGINVTAILCGSDDPSWKTGTTVAKMGYFEIDQDVVVAQVAAPQDAEITALGEAINATYIPFGAEGSSGYARQAAQDTNAINSQPGSGVWRSMTKSSGSYQNGNWDLGDRFRGGNVALAEMAEADLPPAMRGMTAEQRKQYVETKLAERAKIQARIQELGNERAKFLANAPAPEGPESLDSAMLRALTDQARAADLQLE